jgi:HlyD family secretion protein
MKKIREYAKMWWVWTIVIALLIAAAVIVKSGEPISPSREVKAVRGTVQEEVGVTGTVEPASAVDLSFEKGGKITSAPKNVGDAVTTNEVVVRIDNSELIAELAQAEAMVRYQEAKLAELLAGARPEQISASQSKVSDLQDSLVTAQQSLVAAIQTGYSAADDAIHGKTDEFYTNPDTNPEINPLIDSNPETSANSGRASVGATLADLQSLSSSVTADTSLPGTSDQAKDDLGEVKLFLDSIALNVNMLTYNSASSTSLSQATITQWKADLSSARTEVNTAITTILDADNNLKNAEDAVTSAQGELSIEQAGSVPEDIEAQEAEVSEAEASVQSIDAEIDQTYLRSPIDGVITIQNAKVGELATANIPLVSVISSAQFEIEANVAESDIAEVKVGEQANVTLDAYGLGVNFPATVVTIDPAETLVDGVPTYKTTLQFTDEDSRIRSGMTANVDILGDSHVDVIEVPQRAIVEHDGKTYVSLVKGNTATEVPVTVGIKGYDGMTEILSGIDEGDTVVANAASS